MTVNVKPPTADLPALALAALSQVLPPDFAVATPAWTSAMLPDCVRALRAQPRAADGPLVALAEALALSDAELMTLALCVAVERDPEAARAVAAAQSPIGGSRPLVGLAAQAFLLLGATPLGLACGKAAAAGLIELGQEPAALPERSLGVPLPILAACAGTAGAWDRLTPIDAPALPLPAQTVDEAVARGGVLGPGGGLVLRTASLVEGLAVAGHAMAAGGRGLARLDGEPPRGLAPWLIAARRAPVFLPKVGPGERWSPPALGPYAGPWVAILGLDGAVEAETTPDEWTLPVPDLAASVALWRAGGLSSETARRAASTFRQGAGRIGEVAGRARQAAARRGADPPTWDDVAAAVAAGAGPLSALARRGHARVPDEALVLPPSLKTALDHLLDRAQVRCRLHEGLGPAITGRYRPGVKALMCGESGTGKTLAAHWLAGRLGLPLYRVDLAALTSKWIGETEKNLSAILDAAEHADVLLFFDEADAMFASRTDISDSNDRHANAQTNYLLQRIEEFDGVALLASNSRDRFDPAFVRRLDAILEFPLPEAPARRDLWRAHLGEHPGLSARQLDRLAITVDLAGGHIRNMVLAAAARAVTGDRDIAWADVADAVRDEYAKLGRPPPELGPW